ncbi:MAG: carboxypeptidase-like regulatory domain-containing protein, partial [bacterium]
IAGKVVDGNTGDPLPGTNVQIEGTTLGGSTDEAGEYFILNVPPGVYSVKASFIGHAATTVTNVRVIVDQTTAKPLPVNRLRSSPSARPWKRT